MGTARKTRYGMQSDGERKGRKKKNANREKKTENVWKNERTSKEAESTKLLRKSPGLMVPILAIASTG